jgi:hypothetical protein
MNMLRRVTFLSLLSAACGDDGGSGNATFTTWGEEYIEDEIPADPEGQAGFIDGWTLHYDKFLVVFRNIRVADDADRVGAELEGSLFVDNTVPGEKELTVFRDLTAKHWTRVSYQITPPDGETQVVSGDPDDLQMMVDAGYSVYVEGYAEKTTDSGTVRKTFHWGFDTSTQYQDCEQPAESGQALEGLVVTNGGNDITELTTHGDHLFYDRLMASPNPAIQTSLRFDEKAAADTDEDGEITLDELFATRIDVRLYDPSGLDAPSLGAFMTSLARTIGHYRGEGECSISAL